MKTKLITTLILGAAFLAEGALAQTAPATPTSAPAVAVPTTPAPLAPSQIIYAPRLPSVAELTNAAAAQKITVQKIEQTTSQITVVYQYANGQTNTVAYQLLPAANAAAPAAVETAPPSSVVYAPPPRVVYYDSYGPDYYPTYWYPPVSFRLGFGFHGGGFGFRGHGRWR
jgi:hypothetical protein